MTYIENVLVCMVAPLLVALLLLRRKQRPLLLFCLAGMGMCLLAAYLNTFFAQLYAADALNAAAQIAPVVEEIVKLLPLLFYLALFEPDAERFRLAAIVVAASFATFENVCYLTQNGAGQFVYLLIRGFGTGAMHIVCGSVYGRVLRPVWGSRPLRAACLFGLLCVAIIYHAIYNLLVSVGGTAQLLAYATPPCSRRCASACSGSRPQRKSNKNMGRSAFEMDADHFLSKIFQLVPWINWRDFQRLRPVKRR